MSAFIEGIQHKLHALGYGATCGPVDGIMGPRTAMAIGTFRIGQTWRELDYVEEWNDDVDDAARQAEAHQWRLSPHFHASEFATRSTGEVFILRELVRALEAYRERVQAPVPIVSGYRNSADNVRVGGASGSAHLDGAAADVPGALTESEVIALRRFSGIGVDSASGLVIHLDVRHTVIWRADDAGPFAPAVWYY